uniref:NEDD8-conjugating enzyme UBC12 n=2 Tax=Eremothecium gossypii (strain ATCC 10895 / CBS 109.51 / FGSC 9923 / NRRL Y-1056) TaxID=284811 RepID=UBC12_EREGS|nr:RecName: Full=NEDD8-conjugating enzyme UBC12; AltName: Full=RUB1-conjugating enzyme; AltName: Full=Ubiquitin carrier protein 12 [Eremothecium gossypii ATCC 10895]
MLKLRQLQKEKQRQAAQAQAPAQGRSAASPAQLRVEKDLATLELPTTVTLDTKCLGSENKVYLRISPEEGVYRGGHFRFSVVFRDTYPIEPPTVKCLNTIYHPNIDYSGNICLNVLREDWSPVMDLQTVVLGLLFLFLEPNGSDPLNRQAADTMLRDPYRFETNVQATMMGGHLDGQVFDNVRH